MPTKAKAVITDLEVNEVSLVANPANKPSRVTLWKSAAKENTVTLTQAHKKAAQECRNCSTGVDAEDQYCRMCGAPFYKSEEQMTDTAKTETPVEPAVEPAVEPTAEPTPEPAAAPAEPAPVALSAEEIERSVRESIEKKHAEELRLRDERIAKLERAGKVRSKREQVAKSMAAVPASADELAENLVALAEKDAPLAAFVESVLEKCGEALGKSALFVKVSDSAPAPAGVLGEVAALVAKKSAEKPNLTKAQAEAEVWRENPDLYRRYNERA